MFNQRGANAMTATLRRDRHHGKISIALTVSDATSKADHIRAIEGDRSALRVAKQLSELL